MIRQLENCEKKGSWMKLLLLILVYLESTRKRCDFLIMDIVSGPCVLIMAHCFSVSFPRSLGRVKYLTWKNNFLKFLKFCGRCLQKCLSNALVLLRHHNIWVYPRGKCSKISLLKDCALWVWGFLFGLVLFLGVCVGVCCWFFVYLFVLICFVVWSFHSEDHKSVQQRSWTFVLIYSQGIRATVRHGSFIIWFLLFSLVFCSLSEVLFSNINAFTGGLCINDNLLLLQTLSAKQVSSFLEEAPFSSVSLLQ